MMPLRADQGHALAMLSSAGRDDAAQALLSAQGLDASMMAGGGKSRASNPRDWKKCGSVER